MLRVFANRRVGDVDAAGRQSLAACATNLLLMDLERVAVLHLEGVGRVGRLDALALKEEAHRVQALALTLAKGVHELVELGRTLDLEEDLVVVIRDLDV